MTNESNIKYLRVPLIIKKNLAWSYVLMSDLWFYVLVKIREADQNKKIIKPSQSFIHKRNQENKMCHDHIKPFCYSLNDLHPLPPGQRPISPGRSMKPFVQIAFLSVFINKNPKIYSDLTMSLHSNASHTSEVIYLYTSHLLQCSIQEVSQHSCV